MRIRLLPALLLLALSARAELRLGTPFTDHAVLQRETRAPVWGWDDPGARITLTASWGAEASAVAGPDGRWTARLRTARAGGPHTLTIAGSRTVTLTNLLLGEVWLCSGQSNMEWSMGHHKVRDAAAEIAAADHPRLRLLQVPKVSAKEPAATANAAWRVCSPATVGDFSAVGYLFGRDLLRELDVPIGLLQAAWGGTEIEAWIPREGLAGEPSLAAHLDPDAAAACDAAKKAAGSNEPGHRPGFLYNGMVAPLAPYALRGAIWYQGESNTRRSIQYRKAFPLMISEWRRVWDRGDFPFYFVQIAPFSGYASWKPAASSAELREAQLLTYRRTRQTGMVVVSDITDDVRDIHPLNKQDVGARLARWALAEDYGRRVVPSGPLYRDAKVEGSRMRVRFDFGEGLTARGGPLREFEIAGADRVFVPAQAEVDGRTVVVWADGVTQPHAVRLGWSEAPQPNLFNAAGLPASPFRTDDWPGVTDAAVW